MQTDLFSSAASIPDLPDADVRYHPDFIADQQAVFQQLRGAIDWRQDTLRLYGRDVLIPRLNAWYGDAGTDYSYSGIRLAPLPWTDLLRALKADVESALQTTFNSVLANFYRDGSDSVAWHSDDEAELGTAPLIASLSFGATRRFSLRSKTDKRRPPLHLDLAGGSLLVMAGPTQHYWHHQVPKTARAVGGRINLTFRRIVNQ